MNTLKLIKKEKQHLARCEQSLALEKLKKRKADTRRKIELGGLVIKAGMEGLSKSIILGGFAYLMTLIAEDENYIKLFNSKGEHLFLESNQ